MSRSRSRWQREVWGFNPSASEGRRNSYHPYLFRRARILSRIRVTNEELDNDAFWEKLERDIDAALERIPHRGEI